MPSMELNQNWLADQVENSEKVRELESTIADLRGRLGVLECRLRAYELVESRMWRELVAKKEQQVNEQQEGDIERLLGRLAQVDWASKPASVADLEEFAAAIKLALELIQSQGQMIKQLQLAVWQASNG